MIFRHSEIINLQKTAFSLGGLLKLRRSQHIRVLTVLEKFITRASFIPKDNPVVSSPAQMFQKFNTSGRQRW